MRALNFWRPLVLALPLAGCASLGSTDDGCEIYAGEGCEGAAASWSTPTCSDPPSGLARYHHGSDSQVTGSAASRSCSTIAPLADANVLLAICDDALYVSTDAGCTLELLDDSCRYQALVAAPEYGGYATCTEIATEPDQLVRIGPEALVFTPTPDRLLTNIIVDPADREHVLLMNIQPQLYRSPDGGETWASQALDTTSQYPGVRDVTADAGDVDHFVYTDWDYVLRTRDGGASYEIASFSFEGADYQHVYATRLVSSPADPETVLALARVHDGNDELIPTSEGLYRSSDGGLSFTYTNEPFGEYEHYMHPEDPDVFYFLRAEGGDGADLPPTHSSLIRVEGGQATTIDSTARLTTIAFSPADPELLYLGVYDSDW